MNDPSLQKALKWGIENSSASATAGAPPPRTELDQDALMALFGGKQKSDGDYMIENMHVIRNPDMKIEDRLQAFDNFEQLVENLDNANNLEALKLWTPLVELLDNEHSGIRFFAAWCCGTAVQNNIRTQERLLIVGAIPTLARLATEDTDQKVRKKAITAISSAVRNFQAGLDATLEHMPTKFKPEQKLDANDMESVDVLINKLRESV